MTDIDIFSVWFSNLTNISGSNIWQRSTGSCNCILQTRNAETNLDRRWKVCDVLKQCSKLQRTSHVWHCEQFGQPGGKIYL